MARNKELLDTSQRPNYLLAIAQQWLLLTMQIIVAILTTILASLATSLRTVNAGSIGGGLVTLMTFSMTLNVVITSYTGLEIALGGISRLKAFSENTEREDKPGEDTVPGAEWPPKGEIVFREACASYSNDPDALVLSNVSLTIKPREKVALCGRTGRCVFTPSFVVTGKAKLLTFASQRQILHYLACS
jgi:ABC-type multidrug transport system fused ATPase/permease subunit